MSHPSHAIGINLAQKLARIDEAWVPGIVGALNGQHVKLAWFEGEFLWHAHAEEDELFLVIQGRVEIQFRDHAVPLVPGEMCIVPRGVEHRPVAEGRAGVLLFEPSGTRNTGGVDDPLTIEADDLEPL
jgi:mannose-6-phosphate isomerase-like protein (cupin superfamily)